VLSIHYRIPPKGEGDRARWLYDPSGVGVYPLVIGDVTLVENVAAFESQWDMFAVVDKLGIHRTGALPGWAFVTTRGSGNAKLLSGLVPKTATVLAFAQNDTAGRGWLEAVANCSGVMVKHVVTPIAYKDAADWCKADATLNDLEIAISKATVVPPSFGDATKDKGAASEQFDTAIITSSELKTLTLQPRQSILYPFMREGDLGFIYAPRGDGKTWLSMLIAQAIANGTNAGPWKAETSWSLLYIDGEMPAEESKRRLLALGDAGEFLSVLHHEIYFERTGKSLNLTDPPAQQELTGILLARHVRVLVLDNLSCLFSGVKENDADAWELVLPWLLDLRRRRIAVVIVAHAGRNGQMRGTSRREDHAFWVIKLERLPSEEPDSRVLRFTSLFKKCRNCLEDDCPPLEWTIASDGDGPAKVSTQSISGVELLVSWVRGGLESCKDIADEMTVSKGQVSKLAKRAEKQGLITITNGRYRAKGDV